MNDGGYMAVSPLNPDVVFCTGNIYNSAYYLAVSHSTDNGTTWGHDTLAQYGSNGWAVAFDQFDSSRVYVGGDSMYSYPALCITTDLGATWTSSHTGLAGKVNALLTVPDSAGLIYAGTSNGAYKSTDAGLTWTGTGFTRDTRCLAADPDQPGTIYAGTYGYGVYVSTDRGTTWNAVNDGLACNKVLSLALRSGADPMLFAGTDGGAVYRLELHTGIADRSDFNGRTSSFSLSPNPCRAGTAISLRLTANGPARLDIFDASGRLRSSLPVHSSLMTLDPSLLPGVYLVRATAAGRSYTAPLTIVK